MKEYLILSMIMQVLNIAPNLYNSIVKGKANELYKLANQISAEANKYGITKDNIMMWLQQQAKGSPAGSAYDKISKMMIDAQDKYNKLSKLQNELYEQASNINTQANQKLNEQVNDIGGLAAKGVEWAKGKIDSITGKNDGTTQPLQRLRSPKKIVSNATRDLIKGGL